jgi:hypothetical protein
MYRNFGLPFILCVSTCLLSIGCGLSQSRTSLNEPIYKSRFETGLVQIGGTVVPSSAKSIPESGLQLFEVIESIPSLSSSHSHGIVIPVSATSNQSQLGKQLELELESIAKKDRDDITTTQKSRLGRVLSRTDIPFGNSMQWFKGYLIWLDSSPPLPEVLRAELSGAVEDDAQSPPGLDPIVTSESETKILSLLNKADWNQAAKEVSKIAFARDKVTMNMQCLNPFELEEGVFDTRAFADALSADGTFRGRVSRLLGDSAGGGDAESNFFSDELVSWHGEEDPDEKKTIENQLIERVAELAMNGREFNRLDVATGTAWYLTSLEEGPRKKEIASLLGKIEASLELSRSKIQQSPTTLVTNEKPVAAILRRSDGEQYVFPLQFLRNGPMGGLQLADGDKISFYPMENVFQSSNSRLNLATVIGENARRAAETDDMVLARIQIKDQFVNFVAPRDSLELAEIDLGPNDLVGFANSQVNPMLTRSRLIATQILKKGKAESIKPELIPQRPIASLREAISRLAY